MRQVNVAGRRFAVADDKPSFWDKAEAGLWEPALLAELARLTGPGTVFLDIGGWVGPTSLFAASCGADVVALEPDPAAARQFHANCAANPDLATHISVIEAALTADGAGGAFGSPRKQGDSMGSLLLAGQGTTQWQADGISPEALIARLPTGRPLTIKIDIEGGEYLLGSALGTLAALQPQAVLIGFHPALMLSANMNNVGQLEKATNDIFAAFEGMKASVLGASCANPLTEALHTPITVQFSQS
jgi:FkbM family methyltransferase